MKARVRMVILAVAMLIVGGIVGYKQEREVPMLSCLD
jgi:hypothetical protein